MYTCREIEKLLDTYTDGELDEPRRLRVDAHLQGCAPCRQLVHCKEDEARLIRSSDPVPALSAGFTRQVMANLAPGEPRAWGEGFFPLNKEARQALAGPGPGRADAPGDCLLGGVAAPAACHPRAVRLAKCTMNSTPAPGCPRQPPARLRGKPGRQQPGSARQPRVARQPGPAPSPSAQARQEDGHEHGAGGASGTAADKLSELEQQGYTVFQPGYLPAGYSLASFSLQPPGSATGSAGSAGAGTQAVAARPGKDNLLFTYRNAQTGGWITLEIQPLNSSTPICRAGHLSTNGTVTALPAMQPTPQGRHPLMRRETSSPDPRPPPTRRKPAARHRSDRLAGPEERGQLHPDGDRQFARRGIRESGCFGALSPSIQVLIRSDIKGEERLIWPTVKNRGRFTSW